MPDAAVLFSTRPASRNFVVAHAELNAESRLNALTLDMVDSLDTQLAQWAADPAIICVVISGKGPRAFCGGNELRALRNAVLAEAAEGLPWQPGVLQFLTRLYRLAYRLATYPKPVLVWGHGVVVGGGMSVMQAASHRIVTEQSQLALHEVRFGLFPNTGASAYLAHLPRWAGRYLALTGASLNSSDALALNLADFALAGRMLPALFLRLTQLDWSPEPSERFSQLDEMLSQLSRDPTPLLPKPLLVTERGTLGELFEGPLEMLRQRWQRTANLPNWLQRAVDGALSGCPASQLVGEKMQSWAHDKGIVEVLRKELNVSLRMMHAADFAEGVRAHLVDKDKRPLWLFRQLEDVPDGYVNNLITPVWPLHEHPLRDLGCAA